MWNRNAWRRGSNREEDTFELRKLFSAFASLPRIAKLIWSADPFLTLCMAVISLITGSIPALSVQVTRMVVDSVVAGIQIHSIQPIWFPVLLQLLLALFERLLAVGNNIAQQLLQDHVSNKLQIMILEKANTLDLGFFEDSTFYDQLRQASNGAGGRPLRLIAGVFGLVSTFITLSSMFVLLFQLAWWLALIAVLMPIPSFISNTYFGWKVYNRERWQSPERRKLSYLERILTTDSFQKELKLFTLGTFFLKRYYDLMIQLYKESKKLLTRRYLMSFLWTAMTIISNSGIYLYVAIQAVSGRITLGELTLYTQSATQTRQSFNNLLDGIADLYENYLYVQVLYEFLNYQPKIVSPEQPQQIDYQTGLAIEFRNVSFTYPNKEKPALNRVSFTLGAGEAIALVGLNGAGKTTIVKLITRLYDPDEGEILINGINIKLLDLDTLRKEIGVIFQDFVQYHMNVRENIGVGFIEELDNQEAIVNAAEKSGGAAVIARLEEGYETMLGVWFDKGAQLSGGEWQKIALARAFMRNAHVLILDEPTSALDAQAEYDIFTRFRMLTRGKTAVFISHRFSTVRLADRILVLEHGRIVENGSHKDLILLAGRYAELFNLQAASYR